MTGGMIETYIFVAWALVPTFFCVRGFLRDDRADRIAAIMLNVPLITLMGLSGDLCLGINVGGLWFFLVGIGTPALAVWRKNKPDGERLIPMCLAMVVLGIIMMLTG